MKKQPALSVILCTWNNESLLRKTLTHLSRCETNGLEWELVLVDNNSSDATEDVARDFSAKLPLVYILEKKQGLSVARNAGLRAATGEFVVFTDDDVRPAKGWVNEYYSAFERHPERRFFGGPVESDFESARPPVDLLELCPRSIRGLCFGSEEHQPTDGFLSANWACRRSELVAVGGFDENLGLNATSAAVCVGEEMDLQQRLRERGLQPWYLPGASLEHFVPAEKCTLAFIGDRLEAMSYHLERVKPLSDRATKVWRVPRWMIVRCIFRWLTWQVSRVRTPSDVLAFAEYKKLRGRIRACRELA